MSPDQVEQIHDVLDDEVADVLSSDSIDGSLDDASLQEAKRRQASDQSKLNEFSSDSDVTFVGIVNYASDSFERTVDEMDGRLSPPDALFHQWLNVKQSMTDDGVSEVTAHNDAYSEVEYDSRFPRYLQFNDRAETACIEYASRVAGGEHIVFVCYCGEGKVCHRKHVVIEVKKWLDVLSEITSGADEEHEYTELSDFE